MMTEKIQKWIMDIKKFLTHIKSNRESFFETPGTIQYNLIQYENVYTGLPHWHSHFNFPGVLLTNDGI